MKAGPFNWSTSSANTHSFEKLQLIFAVCTNITFCLFTERMKHSGTLSHIPFTYHIIDLIFDNHPA